MKLWSKLWKASTQPRKQRKYRANAPLHIRRKLVSAHLSKELHSKHNMRNIPIIVGDKVKIARGSFKNKTGTIEKVDRKDLKVFVSGIENIKKDGSKSLYPIDPSNVIIIELKLDDKKRIKSNEDKNGKKSP